MALRTITVSPGADVQTAAVAGGTSWQVDVVPGTPRADRTEPMSTAVGEGVTWAERQVASVFSRGKDPGHRAARHGVRAAIVMSVAFFIGHFGFDNDQLAVLATFTGAALAGMADFTGDRTQRLLATSITLAVGFPLVALGTAVSLHTVAATVVMFVVALVIAFGAVFSGYFAAGANAAIVFFVVAVGIPGSTHEIPPRLAGVALGGGLSVLASGWLLPCHAVSNSRRSLGAVYLALADAVRQAAHDEQVDRPARDALLKQAILDAELAVATSAWRPGGLTRAHKSRMYLLHGAQRLATLLAQLPPLRPDLSVEIRMARQKMLIVQAETLGACADALTSNGAVHPDPTRAQAAMGAFDSFAAEQLEHRIAAADQRDIDQRVADLLVLLEIARTTVLAGVHTRIVFGIRPDPEATVANAVLVATMTVGVPSPRKWLRRATHNLTFRSVHFRNSLRLATALALARLAVGVFDLKHGFWVMFATLVVVKTSAAGTRTTAVGAAIGTGLGFLVSTALVIAFGVHVSVYCVALPILIFAAFYLPGTGKFLLGQACFTMTVVFLFNILVPTGWSVGLLRFEDVLIGTAIGMVVGLLMWPKGASTELAGAIADLVDAGTAIATSLVRSLLDGEHLAPDASDRWVPAIVAATQAEDVFTQFLSELHVPPAPVLAWSSLMSAGHQLWYGAAVVGGLRVPTDAKQTTPQLRRAVGGEVTDMERDFHHLARTLREGVPLALEPPAPFGHPLYPEHPVTTFRLLQVHAWIGELTTGLGQLQDALEATVIPAPAGEPVATAG
jgi:uncharacterized membrane protein YccC